MKKCIAALLISLLCLSACAPKETDFILPTVTPAQNGADAPAANREPFLPGISLKDMKSFTEASAAFDGTVWMDGLDEALLNTGIIPALTAAHGGELYMIRNYPRDLIVPAKEHIRTPGEPLQVEVYAPADGSKPVRMISLQAPGGAYVFFSDIFVDADGIFLLLSSADGMKDGVPDIATWRQSVAHYSFDGELLDEQPAFLPMNFAPLNLLRTGGETFLLIDDSLRPESTGDMTDAEKAVFDTQQTAYRRLCVLDTASGAFELVERAGMENAALWCTLAYPDGRLLCVDMVIRPDGGTAARTVQVSVFNPANGTSEIRSFTYLSDGDYSEHQMTYDETADTLFFFLNKELLAWKLDSTAPIVRLKRFDQVRVFDALCAADGRLFFIPKTVKIDCYSNIILPEGAPLAAGGGAVAFGIRGSTTLSILLHEMSRRDAAIMQERPQALDYLPAYYNARNLPATSLKPSYLGTRFTMDPETKTISGAEMFASMRSYQDAVAKKLLAGDDDFDLFLLGSGGWEDNLESITSVINSGYILPLEELGTGVTAPYDNMLPGIKDICTANGKLVLVPLEFGFHGLQVNTAILKKLGLTPADIPRTADAFIEFADTHATAVTTAGYDMFSYNAKYTTMKTGTLSQYFVEFFENESGTDAMWDKMMALNACFDRHSAKDYDYDFSKVLFTQGEARITGEHIANDRSVVYVPFPLLNENAKNVLSGTFLCVNPNSKNLDAVAEFLETFLSEDYWTHIINKAKAPTTWDNAAAAQEYFERIRMSIYEIPGIDTAFYPTYNDFKDMLTNASRGYPGDLDQLNQPYFFGEITAEEWRTRVDRNLEFLRDE